MEKIFYCALKLNRLFFILLCLSSSLVIGQSNNSFIVLKKVLDSVDIYDSSKVLNIKELNLRLNSLDKTNLTERFNLSQELFGQYIVFKRDSAFSYALQTKRIAESVGDKQLQNRAYLNLADICVSGGMYKEGFDYLNSIDTTNITKEIASYYYGIMGRCYSDMAEYSNLPYFNDDYDELAKKYRNKAVLLTEKGTFYYSFLVAFNKLKSKKYKEAQLDFEDLLKAENSAHDLALTHFMLGEIYSIENKPNAAIEHFTLATINDVRTSTKESLAMIRLAELLFKKGDLLNASLVINKAYDDSRFYGAQQRKLQIGAVLPLIEQEILKNIEREKTRLYWQYVGVTVFLIIVLLFTGIIIIQFKRLQKAKKVIANAHNELQDKNVVLLEVNKKLNESNNEIIQVNSRLFEANKIKEEYLGFFFTEYDDIFEKFNELIIKVDSYLDLGEYEKVKYHLSKYNPRKEKDKLLHNFDTAFINLFPNFINEFNSLMKEGQQIRLKENQILNKELRIFALIRLGVTHNEKIAQILGYSVNSIYAFKTKVRNKSLIENEKFDLKLNENTSIRA
ncbi:DUF6377 domain-containing protein [Aestuariibaculum suncheonense]|uniref:DUF6377 domain-containing protein n=1 Tax=Aestuariibaculum suncheonense TaxID=1028745 RepID=A0A8J6Q966_9FLAO|nr:DUF6377 domain-containing protein [Aestuariibaculum suncheonense]MBD0836092.1 hypothetical protein [Aestuariibaculum suncheonense]